MNAIRGLSLLTSCGCNLKCEYCRIAQSVNSGSAQLQQNTIKALQDGTYRENVKQVLFNLHQSPAAIEGIAFWGQEPTLTLHHISAHLEEWFELFPNWSQTMFSTNCIAHMDRIVEFCDRVEECSKGPFSLQIQLSYDGDYSTNNLRGASSSVIHDNIVYLITELNKRNFQKLFVRFNHHGVLSMDLLSKLQSTDEIINYASKLYEWGEEFYQLGSNKRVELVPDVDLGLENPVEASPEDGMRLAYFCDLCDRIGIDPYLDIAKYHPVPAPPSVQLYASFNGTFDQIAEFLRNEHQIDNLDMGLDIMMQDTRLFKDFCNEMNPSMYCGNGVGELKIMWDGTLINCQNHIYETDVNLLPTDNSITNATKRALATHGYFINPLKDDKTLVDKYFHLFNTVKFNSFEFIYKSIVNLMHFLAETGQIHESYRDPRKIWKHALIITMQNACSYNSQIMTGSIFLKHTGFIRLYCNGFLDRAIAHFNGREGGLVL